MSGDDSNYDPEANLWELLFTTVRYFLLLFPTNTRFSRGMATRTSRRSRESSRERAPGSGSAGDGLSSVLSSASGDLRR